jgi:hypothetical protein
VVYNSVYSRRRALAAERSGKDRVGRYIIPISQIVPSSQVYCNHQVPRDFLTSRTSLIRIGSALRVNIFLLSLYYLFLLFKISPHFSNTRKKLCINVLFAHE